MQKNRSQRTITPLLYSCIALLLALLFTEVACRLLGIGDPAQQPWRKWQVHKHKDMKEGLLYTPGSSYTFHYSSNPRSYFDSNNQVTGTINEQGFRGPSITYARQIGVSRVVMLGDSITFGTGVQDDDTIPALLEQQLVKKRPVEVVNLGLGGSATKEQYNILYDIGVRYNPDLVILIAYPNDVLNVQHIPRLHIATPHVLRYSQFATALYQTLRSYLVEQHLLELFQKGFHPSSPEWHRMKKYIQKIQAHCRKFQIPFLLVMHPVLYQLDDRYPLQEQRALLQEFCTEESLHCLDLFDSLEGSDYQSLWVHPADPHPNEHANMQSSAAIAAAIERMGLLSESTRTVN